MKIETCERRHSYDTDLYNSCPFCHEQPAPESVRSRRTPSQYLPEGSLVASRYLLERVADENDMCIVYGAIDTSNNTRVYLEEFFPLLCADRDTAENAGIHCTDLDKAQQFILGVSFMKEQARVPINGFIGRVLDVLEYGGTVYAVSERIEWPSLAKWIPQQKALRLMQAFTILKPLALQLLQLHEQKLFHGNLNLQTVHISKGMVVSAEKPAFYRFAYQHLLLHPQQDQSFPLQNGILLDRHSIAMILLKLCCVNDLQAICELPKTSAFFAGFDDTLVSQIKPVFLSLLQGITNESLDALWKIYALFLHAPATPSQKPEAHEETPVTVQSMDAYFPRVMRKRRHNALKWLFILLVLLSALGAGLLWLLPML